MERASLDGVASTDRLCDLRAFRSVWPDLSPGHNWSCDTCR